MKFSASINTILLGYEWRTVLFKVTNTKVHEKLMKFIATHKTVDNTFKMVGEYNFYVNVISKDSMEFNKFMTELNSEFRNDIVKIDRTLLFGQEYFTWLPEGVKEDLEKNLK